MPGFNIGGVGGSGPVNTTETARKNRFLVRVLNPLSADLLFFAHKLTPPSGEIDRVVMHHKQEEIYLPGKSRWSQIDISFYRALDNNGDKAAREIYDWRNQVMNIGQSSLLADQATGSPIKRNATIVLLEGTGLDIYRYNLYGIWPQKIAADQLDWGDSAVSEIVVTMFIDKMTEEPIAAPVMGTEMCGESPIILQNPIQSPGL